LVVGMLSTTSEAAAAERPTVSLRYSIADGVSACPNETTLRLQVTEAVGYDPFVSDATRSLAIEISHDKLFTARVADKSTSGAEAVRTLTSSVSCDDLLQSVVLAVAVSLDPEVQPKSVEKPLPPKRPEVTMVPVLVPVYVERPPTPVAKPVRRDSIEGFVAGGFGVGGGFVPGTSLGPTLALGFRRRQWEVALEGTVQLPGDAESEFGKVEVLSVMASAVPCYTPALSTWGRALVCGSVAMGGAFASASNVETSTPAVLIAAFTGPRAGIAFHAAPHVDVRLAGDLWVNVAPLDAQIRGTFGELFPVYQSPPIAGRAITSVAASFP
jgi:hypothetical protein